MHASALACRGLLKIDSTCEAEYWCGCEDWVGLSFPIHFFLTLFTMFTWSVFKRGDLYQFGHAKSRRLCSFLPMQSKHP